MHKMTRMPEGNYLRKAKTNVSLSDKCRKRIAIMEKDFGLSGSGIIEISVMEKFERRYGENIDPDAVLRKSGGA